MTRDLLQMEEAIFASALALPDHERPAYLDSRCATDVALRGRIEGLLKAHADSDVLLDVAGVAAKASRAARSDAIPNEMGPGDRIGRYTLVERIGEGGWGSVYVAQQQEPVHRLVALKVIKLGMDTREVIARFEAERQALALMDHPHIARVFDAGATETGRLYFVMELVRGTKITDYCDQKRLPTAERLRLFVRVCHAIQHAHQKGIIHRDIKPSNILVSDTDGLPVPKVIDFGIAKATQGRLTDTTVHTAIAQFIGTPAYMSPEQAGSAALDVDTRSDIYSLGVLLYELLTGRTPLDERELAREGLDAIRQRISEREPVRPSTRLSSTDGAGLKEIAAQRATEPSRLVHLVRGDLDWIVVRCLEKDRQRRYETANGLALDVQRHLAHEPVVARPPSALYRFAKYARRHRTVMAATSAVGAALVVGAAFAFMGRQRALEQKVAAEAARTQAEDLVGFMIQDLRPGLEQYGRLSLMDQLARQSVGYFEALPANLGGPRTDRNRAAALEALAEVRRAKGDLPAALALWDEALEARRNAVRVRSDDPVAAAELAWTEWNRLTWDEPLDVSALVGHSSPQLGPRMEAVVERLRRLHTGHPNNPAVTQTWARVLSGYGAYLALRFNRSQQAVSTGEEATRLFRALLDRNPDSPRLRADYASALVALTLACDQAADFERSIEVGRDALAFIDAALQVDPGNVLLLENGATAAINLASRMHAVSRVEAHALELGARERWRALIAIDPANQRFRRMFAKAHRTEALDLATRQGLIEPAWRAFTTLVELLTPYAREPGDYELLESAEDFRAILAGLTGDFETGRRLLESARGWHRKIRDGLPPEVARSTTMRFRRMLLDDRTVQFFTPRESESAARAALAVMDEMERESPFDVARTLDRGHARLHLGRALLDLDRSAEAVSVIEAALIDLRDPPPEIKSNEHDREFRERLRGEVVDALAEACIGIGEKAKARSLLEPNYFAREAMLAAMPDRWPREIHVAETASLLASVLDPLSPEDALRRTALIERATVIVERARREGRIIFRRDLPERLVSLRAADQATQ